jgi:hypothetical protein
LIQFSRDFKSCFILYSIFMKKTTSNCTLADHLSMGRPCVAGILSPVHLLLVVVYNWLLLSSTWFLFSSSWFFVFMQIVLLLVRVCMVKSWPCRLFYVLKLDVGPTFLSLVVRGLKFMLLALLSYVYVDGFLYVNSSWLVCLLLGYLRHLLSLGF